MENFLNTDEIQQALSAYVDGELDFTDRRRVEELIQSDPNYAQEVAQLRLLKRWLQDLPAPAPRRSFTLDPQTAPRPRRLVFGTLRWATAIAAVLLMLTVSVDVIGRIGSGFGGGAGTSAVAPAASGSTANGGSASAARSVGTAAASGSSGAAQDLPDTAAQEAAVPSASAAAAPSASASAAAAADAASSGASASMAADQSAGSAAASAYSAPSESLAAATLASPNASSGAGASIVAAPSLADTRTTAPDTVDTLFAANQQPAPVNTLRIAQIVLLIATTVLGAGTWLAKQRNI